MIRVQISHEMDMDGIGCFGLMNGATHGQVFAWEFMMTFVLVSVVFATAVNRKGFGNITPLAIGGCSRSPVHLTSCRLHAVRHGQLGRAVHWRLPEPGPLRWPCARLRLFHR